MRGAVALGMLEVTPVGKDVRQRELEVAYDVGIGILVDGDRGGGMRAIHHAQPLLDAAFPHDLPHSRRDIDEPVGWRLQFESLHVCLALK